MKLNIANPTTGQQTCIEVTDEKKLRVFYDLRMGDFVPADGLGPEWAGYQFKITGGNDKQGFPMMQGVLKSDRVRLLLKGGMKCYRQRRAGERKKKSVRGCIVGADLSILNLVVSQKGEGDIEGLTDAPIPRRLGPKRANKIRKLFNLEKSDDVRGYVIARKVTRKSGKELGSTAVVNSSNYEQVIIAEYPSQNAFLAMGASEEYRKVSPLRHQGLSDTMIISMPKPTVLKS